MKVKIADVVLELERKNSDGIFERFLVNSAADYSIILNDETINSGQFEIKNPHFKIIFFQDSKDIYLKLSKKSYFYSAMLNLISLLVVLNEGVLLHSSGCAISRDEAILFSGEADSGKTTIACRLNLPILSDEAVALKLINDKVYAFPTPFGMGDAINAPYIVKFLFFLDKKGRNKIVKVKRDRIAKRILSNILFPQSACLTLWDKMLNNVASLSKKLDAYEI